MLGEHLPQSIPKIFQNMPAIGHLYGLGCAFGRPLSVGARAIAGNNLNSWVLAQPCCKRLCGSVWQQINWAALIQIDQNRAIGSAFALRPVVHAEAARRRHLTLRRLAH